MASARKQSAGRKPAKQAKPPVKKQAAAKSSGRPAGNKPAKAARPAARVAKPAVRPAAKARPVSARAGAAKPAPARVAPGRPAPGKPAPGKPAPGKPASGKPAPGKPASGKPAPGKPAVKGAPIKAADKVIVPKPAPKAPPRLVPATAAAKLRAAKPPTGKTKGALRAAPEVRPLGVLPPESIAKPRHVPARPPVMRSREVAPPRPAPARKGDEERLGPEDLKHFEKRLLSERARIMREMGYLDSTLLKVNPRDSAGELSGYSFHMADAGTDSMEREKAFDLASKEGRLLMEIDDALRRLYNGSYGICESTGKPISRARLEALPWARLSLAEQEKLEKDQKAGRASATSTE